MRRPRGGIASLTRGGFRPRTATSRIRDRPPAAHDEIPLEAGRGAPFRWLPRDDGLAAALLAMQSRDARASARMRAGRRQGSLRATTPGEWSSSVLDEFAAQEPGGPQTGRVERAKRRRHGLPNHRLIRYADDWCLVISGSRSDAEALQEKITRVLATMGLRLSPAKTLITHIDLGLDFLGWRIQRHRKRGSNRHYVYTYPAKKVWGSQTRFGC